MSWPRVPPLRHAGVGSVQEAMDLALVAHAATLEARLPFLHSSTASPPLTRWQSRAAHAGDLCAHRRPPFGHRAALSSEHPVIRGTAQKPDVYFQARENRQWRYYLACPRHRAARDGHTRRASGATPLFDTSGRRMPSGVIVLMGLRAETVQETVEHLVAVARRVGVLKVRLYRPFSSEHFLAPPAFVRRSPCSTGPRRPGSVGEPLYLDVWRP